jgi:hypothetical protein
MGRIPVSLPAGTTTGRVAVGRWTLYVGADAGTILEPAEEEGREAGAALAAELDEQGVDPASAPDRVVAAVESVEEVTRRAEHLTKLFTDVVTGRVLSSEFLKREVDSGFELLRRLDKADRFEDELKLAQHLVRGLMLLGRWAAVVQTLRIAFRAASAHANTAAEAWVRNELGALATSAGNDATGQRLLSESLRLREGMGDGVATEVTRHNLHQARSTRVEPVEPAEPTPFLRRLGVRLAVATGAAAALTIAVLTVGGGDEDRTPALPPKVEITDGPRARTRATIATFRFRADPPTVALQCRLDGGRFERCVSPAEYRVGQRSHVFRVRAVGIDRTLSNVARHEWVVLRRPEPPGPDDTQGPVVTITEHPDERTTSPTAAFEFEPGEKVSGFECSVDEQRFRRCASPHPVRGPLLPRVHRFDVRATDLAGNRGNATRYRWRVLAAAGPAVRFTQTPKTPTNVLPAVFAYAATGAQALECALDGREPARCGDRITYERLEDGSHTFAVRAFGAAGARGPLSEFVWELDTVPPVVTVARVAEQFELRANEEVRGFECSLDGADFAECSSPHAVPGPIDPGTRTFDVRADDLAGNRGQAEQYTWRVRPDRVVFRRRPNRFSNDRVDVFLYTARGAASYECGLDRAELSTCGTQQAYRRLKDRTYTFYVRAVGPGGIRGPLRRVTWTRDTRAPLVTSVDRTEVKTKLVGGEPAGVESTTFAFESDERLVGFRCRRDDEKDFSRCASPQEFTGAVRTLDVLARDRAGNVGPAHSWPASIDIPT